MENLLHIIKLSSKGDELAQRKLYLNFRSQWYMIAMRYGKNKFQADDIFQEGLIQIFNSLHQFDQNKASFSTWSTRVLINAALKYLKKYNWIDSFQKIEDSMVEEDQQETIYQKLAAKELVDLIQKLPLGYRLVFNMFAMEGYAHKDIAKELGITVGTSKSQLSKARNTLRIQLEILLNDSHHG